jgi:4-hydroxy-2-oxoheptanedioate aldolase
MIFIGPNDLALSLMGYTPGSTEPETGILVNNGDLAREAKKRFDFVVIGGDVKALGFWFAAQLEAAAK